MHIVHVFKDFYPPLAAGITCYIADVSDWMAEHGHTVEVHVAGVRTSRRERTASGVLVHRHREYSRLLSMPLCPGLVREVRNLDADVLHLHLPNPIGELGAVLNQRSPILCSFHARLGRQRFLEPLYGPLREALLTRSSSILVAGSASTMAPELRHHQGKVHILPYGVSPRLLGAPTKVRPPDSQVRLLFVGRLVYYKGVNVLLRTMALTPHATLRLVGDGKERASLEALAHDLGIEGRVRFLGLLSDPDLRNEYAQADAFVLPSISHAEAFGLAMVEAMANGLPAISTALGTNTDWVNLDGITGYVVPPNDINSLASAINALIDPSLTAALGAAAATRARTHFSFDRHAEMLEEKYSEATR